MDIFVLDENFNSIGVVEGYTSFIWTDRYDRPGDFEIYALANTSLVSLFMTGSFVTCSLSDRMMVIESIAIETDVETGNKLTVKGRSLESILDRRIVWYQTILSGSLESGVQKLLNENAISPAGTERTIPHLTFRSSNDARISSLTVEAQLFGETLLETIESFCQGADLGFKMIREESGDIVFSLYKGLDRSYDQLANPYVIFSPDFDNLLNSNYSYDTSTSKNTAKVGGEGEGADRKTKIARLGGVMYSGFARREIFVDAGSVSSNSETEISPEEYLAQLEQKGLEQLASLTPTYAFDCETNTQIGFVLGKDYFLGDVVQFENEYGMRQSCRVSEMIFSLDANGFTSYPTFSKV